MKTRSPLLLATMAAHMAAFQAKAALGFREKREDPSIKTIADAIDKINTAFEEYKKTNDQRIEAIKSGASTEALDAKLARIDEHINAITEAKSRLEKLETKLSRPGVGGGDVADGADPDLPGAGERAPLGRQVGAVFGAGLDPRGPEAEPGAHRGSSRPSWWAVRRRAAHSHSAMALARVGNEQLPPSTKPAPSRYETRQRRCSLRRVMRAKGSSPAERRTSPSSLTSTARAGARSAPIRVAAERPEPGGRGRPRARR